MPIHSRRLASFDKKILGVSLKQKIMPRLIIIADDLTGAADTAACFAQAGLRTVVALDEAVVFLENPASFIESVPGAGFFSDLPTVALPEVFSLSTDSRQVTADEAARRVRRAVDWLRKNRFETPGTFYYKKIDSLLRGHPAFELAAMLDALGLDQALVAPAFPTQGRLTLAGRQVVATGSPAQQIDLGQVFSGSYGSGAQASLAGIHWLALDQVRQGWASAQPGLYIADAESEADLEALAYAMAAQGFRLACGSAGLARALQRVFFQTEGRSLPAARPAKAHLPILVVAGSRAPALAHQVEAARQSGIRLLVPGASFLEGAAFQPEELGSALADTLRGGQPVILTTAGLPLSPLGEAMVAGRLAAVAGWLVEAGLVGGLLLTGGDTAAAVCRRLGASLIELHGEPQPGIAAGSLLDGSHAGLPVITKAGSFECDLGLLIEEFRF